MKESMVTPQDRLEADSKLVAEIEKSREKLKKQIEKEYKKVRRSCEDLRVAYAYFDAAQTYDDVYFRLLALEKQVKKIRKGGFLSSGARKHQKLLKKLQKIGVE